MILFYATVRLVYRGDHSELTSKGRVEVYYNGSWGTVCDDYWDLTDANVVCRQLGFTGAMAANKTAAFGRGEGKIWMDSIQCTGDESSLTECDHQGWGSHNCGHDEDAGVICTPGDSNYIILVVWQNLTIITKILVKHSYKLLYEMQFQLNFDGSILLPLRMNKIFS